MIDFESLASKLSLHPLRDLMSCLKFRNHMLVSVPGKKGKIHQWSPWSFFHWSKHLVTIVEPLIRKLLTTSIMEQSWQPRPNRWSHGISYGTWMKNRNECCLDFIGQSIHEISHFSSVRHCLRPSKWRVRRFEGRNSRPIAKLRYPFEPPFDAESKLYI